jgi:hypothetical protein
MHPPPRRLPHDHQTRAARRAQNRIRPQRQMRLANAASADLLQQYVNIHIFLASAQTDRKNQAYSRNHHAAYPAQAFMVSQSINTMINYMKHIQTPYHISSKITEWI